MDKLLGKIFVAAFTILIVGQVYGQVQPSPEVAVLKAQIETMKDYQEQFIEVVLWSLGVVVSIVLGLLAVGWYSNKTNYDRDRRFLEQERKVVEEEIQVRLQQELINISEKLTSLISEREGPLKEKIEGLVISRIGSVSSGLSDLKGDVLDLRYQSLKLEADDAFSKKKFRWAIYKYRQALEISIERGFDFQFSDLLDLIKKCLVIPEWKIDSDELSELVGAFKKLPLKYGVASERLIELARQKL